MPAKESDLEPMEQEVVKYTLENYRKKKGLNPDDAESAAVAAGDLVRRPDGSLAPRGWKAPAQRLVEEGAPAKTRGQRLEEEVAHEADERRKADAEARRKEKEAGKPKGKGTFQQAIEPGRNVQAPVKQWDVRRRQLQEQHDARRKR